MPIIIGIILILGIGGGTAIVSDSSVPGDALFPVDQAFEKIRLVIANENGKKELKAKFAKERIDEVAELLEKQSKEKADEEDSDDDDTATSSDEGVGDDEANKNVADGLSFAIGLLGEINVGGEYDDLVAELNALLPKLPPGTELDIKLSDSGASFIKIRSEDDGSQKLKVEIKETGGGKVLIKQRTGDGKMEVEIEDGTGKFKIKTEDDGKIKIETEVKEEDSKDDDDDDDASDEDKDEDKSDEDKSGKNGDDNSGSGSSN